MSKTALPTHITYTWDWGEGVFPNRCNRLPLGRTVISAASRFTPLPMPSFVRSNNSSSLSC